MLVDIFIASVKDLVPDLNVIDVVVVVVAGAAC